MARVDWFSQVKAWPVAEVAARFGLPVHRRGADVSFPCPACGKERRHTKGKDSRLAAKATHEGAGWWCEPCDQRGDAVSLVALRVTGRAQPEASKWAEVRAQCAAVGLCEPDQRGPAVQPVRPYVPPPRQKPLEGLKRLPAAEVGALWAACLPLDAVPSWDEGFEWTGAARRYLASRGYDISALAWLELARTLPPASRYPWPSWWAMDWSRTWRVAVPLFDAGGAMVALQARAIEPSKAKTMNPRGSGAVTGAVFADAGGLEVLKGSYKGPRIVIAEGLTDYLTAALIASTLAPDQRPAVLGVVAGGAQALTGVQLAGRPRLNVLTDNDASGERYFRDVKAALPGLDGFRVRLRPIEGKQADLNDYWRLHPDLAVAALTHDGKGNA